MLEDPSSRSPPQLHQQIHGTQFARPVILHAPSCQQERAGHCLERRRLSGKSAASMLKASQLYLCSSHGTRPLRYLQSLTYRQAYLAPRFFGLWKPHSSICRSHSASCTRAAHASGLCASIQQFAQAVRTDCRAANTNLLGRLSLPLASIFPRS